jgi:hypothetical protein
MLSFLSSKLLTTFAFVVVGSSCIYALMIDDQNQSASTKGIAATRCCYGGG